MTTLSMLVIWSNTACSMAGEYRLRQELVVSVRIVFDLALSVISALRHAGMPIW